MMGGTPPDILLHPAVAACASQASRRVGFGT
jgi:hypothetical protein